MDRLTKSAAGTSGRDGHVDRVHRARAARTKCRGFDAGEPAKWWVPPAR